MLSADILKLFHCSSVPLNLITDNDVHFSNQLPLTELTLPGIVISLRFFILANILSPLEVTVSGSTMLSAAQPENALIPMVFRFGGRIISLKLVHIWKAPQPIKVTLSGIFTLARFAQPENIENGI